MKRSLFLFLAGMVHLTMWAQYEPQFSHYLLFPLQFNPAYAGSREGVEFAFLHRSQNVGLTNQATATQFANIHAPVSAISSGLGLTLINDLIGYQRSTSVNVNYAWRKELRKGTFSIGVGVGFIQTGLQGNKLVTPGGDYTGGVDHRDNYVPATLQNGIAPDFSVGLRWGNSKYHIGLSANHLYSFATLKTSSSKTRINYARNMAFTAAYRFDVSKNFNIMPAVLVKTDFRQYQAELSALMQIKRNFLTGIAFRGYEGRAVDAAVFYIGLDYKGLRVLYSYDANVSYLTKFNTGSHEISASYLLPFKKKQRQGYYYHNARFL
ncbi:MAG: PorP/SprF family type IX secretion system membrane protein [Chitinophagales bacterium]